MWLYFAMTYDKLLVASGIDMAGRYGSSVPRHSQAAWCYTHSALTLDRHVTQVL